MIITPVPYQNGQRKTLILHNNNNIHLRHSGNLTVETSKGVLITGRVHVHTITWRFFFFFSLKYSDAQCTLQVSIAYTVKPIYRDHLWATK